MWKDQALGVQKGRGGGQSVPRDTRIRGRKGKSGWGPLSLGGELTSAIGTSEIGMDSPRTEGLEGGYAAQRIEGGRSPTQAVLDGSCKVFLS